MPTVRQIRSAIRTISRQTLGRSDRSRWAGSENLQPVWDERTAALATLIPPNSRVLEFGAGRRSLENFLPPGCHYTPSDLVDRGPGTIVCDLNGPVLPSFPPQDVVVFSGVLEYIHDLPRLVGHLNGRCTAIAASYAPSHKRGVSARLHRRAQGWVNDYTSEELVALFAAGGFRCESSQESMNQQLFRFVLAE